jgi:hypothetical protein
MNFKSTALAVTALILSTTTNAAIISTNWLTVGDNLITQDTTTGLEWLDLTVTTSRSYDDISSQFGAGQEFEGWRYATATEINGFFDAFGGDNNFYNGWSVQNNGLFDRLSAYWGDTYCEFAGCQTGDGYSQFLSDETSHYVGFQYYGTIYDLYLNNQSASSDFIEFDSRYIANFTTSPAVGSALVKATVVPIPSAVWLFGSGLLGLLGIARRKMRA